MNSIDEDMRKAMAQKLAMLDDQHRRATTPAARRRIESQIAEVHRQVAHHDVLSKTVDIAYERWKRECEKEDEVFKRMIAESGYTPEEFAALNAEMERDLGKIGKKK